MYLLTLSCCYTVVLKYGENVVLFNPPWVLLLQQVELFAVSSLSCCSVTPAVSVIQTVAFLYQIVSLLT